MRMLKSWDAGFRLARAASAEPARLRQFESLHPEQASRAVYFIAMADAIRDLGLSNPFERSALTVEPTHPVPPSRVGAQIAKLPEAKNLRDAPSKHKLSLLSLQMLAEFAPESEAPTLRKIFARSPLQILDPLYGFIYVVRHDGTFHNHCLAIDFWKSRLDSMPPNLATDLWDKRSDNMLSGGAFSGRLLFSDLVPDQPDNLRRSEVPELVVHSEEQLLDVVATLRQGSTKLPNVQLWFRGQARDYYVPDRRDLNQKHITPYSNIADSDFTPSLYRRYDDSLERINSYEMLLIELAQWVEAAKSLFVDDPILQSTYIAENPHALTNEGLSSFQRGLILQQYGAPSAYLDITRDPLTAAWFATNDCAKDASGKLTFTQKTWAAPEAKDWPTIFVFPLVKGAHPFLDLDSILPQSGALRPHRQMCGLLGGAGNLARNYCARYLGLKLRLHPDFLLRAPVNTSHLFPPASEDPALGDLLSKPWAREFRQYPITTV